MAKKFFDVLPPHQEVLALKENQVFFSRKKKKGGKGLMLVLALVIFAAAGGLFSYIYLSRAEAEIWPETKKFNFKTEVLIRDGYGEPSSSWFAEKTIPGKLFAEEKESSKEFSSSGVVEKKEFARGKIRIQNKSKNPLTLIKNTRFLSDEGKQFHSLKEATVPAKGYTDGVEVLADAAGEDYNIGPSKFSVPNLRKYSTTLFYDIWAESSDPMTGGFLGKTPQITEDDIKNAEAELSEKLFAEAKSSLNNTVGSQDYMFPDGAEKLELGEKFTFAKAGQEMKSFIFKAKVKSSGLAFKKADAESLARDFIYSQIGLDKKLVEKSLNLDYTLREKDLDKGKMTVGLKISADIYSALDMQNLKNKIKGKTAIDGKNFLEKEDGISRVEVNLWPPWVKRVPKNDEKIEMLMKVD